MVELWGMSQTTEDIPDVIGIIWWLLIHPMECIARQPWNGRGLSRFGPAPPGPAKPPAKTTGAPPKDYKKESQCRKRAEIEESNFSCTVWMCLWYPACCGRVVVYLPAKWNWEETQTGHGLVLESFGPIINEHVHMFV